MYPPFVNHSVDVTVTMNVVVGQVAIAMFGYMTEIDKVDMTDTETIEAEGES